MRKLLALLALPLAVQAQAPADRWNLAALYASDAAHSRWHVFLASSAALVVAAGIGVLAGAAIGKAVPPHVLKWVAGIGFVAIGVWTIAKA